METGTLRDVASFDVPPNSSMISETVMVENSVTENRNTTQAVVPESAVYPELLRGHVINMMKTGEILGLLLAKVNAKEITKTEIAEAAGIGKSRVSELFGSGTGRNLSHDEAVKLVERFQLESPPAQKVSPVPGPIARLVVLYVAQELGIHLEERPDQLEELAEDVRAFAEYVADPQVRESLDAAEHFFRAIRVRRPGAREVSRPETDPLKTQR